MIAFMRGLVRGAGLASVVAVPFTQQLAVAVVGAGALVACALFEIAERIKERT